MADVVLVTLDTGLLDEDGEFETYLRSIAAAVGIVVDVRTGTSNVRERGWDSIAGSEFVPEPGVWNETPWGAGSWGSERTVAETMVIGHSTLDQGVFAQEGDSRLDAILDIISNGSFPSRGERSNLSKGQRNQLYDAMTLEGHARARRHVFVTTDAKAFVRGGRRERLEELYSTRIITRDEVGVTWP